MLSRYESAAIVVSPNPSEFAIRNYLSLHIHYDRENPNWVYEVALDVHFGHELANPEFWVTKLPGASFLITPSR
jgi:hypothetical protein